MRRLPIVLLMCCLAAPAWAMNVDGKVGIGFEETLLNMGTRLSRGTSSGGTTLPDVVASGLAVRGYVGDVGLEAIVSGDWHKPQSGPQEGAVFGALGIIYQLWRAPNVNLGVGVRGLAALSRVRAASDSNAPTSWRHGFGAELPIRAEYFFSHAFSISGAVGVVLAFNGEDGNPLTGRSNSTDVAIGHADFSGGVGFTYYFR